MPDKNLTDNEIVKALECCVKNKCPECPYFHSYPCDKCRKMQTDALDLINRQKEEIERLTTLCTEQDIEIAQLYKRIDEAKSEARKEFAERLKARDGYDNHNFDDCASILVPEEYRKGRDEKIKEIWNTIDNLLIEMESESSG